jgi:nucleoid-associated protein YgaU
VAATIGIKIANGEFYSVLTENSFSKKGLILTTVHNNQSSVQIDLYKSVTKTMADALYIGSLVVENIAAKPKGVPSIQLNISSDLEGNITADALDQDRSNRSGHQYLSVSLRTLDDDVRDYDIPDFEVEEDESPPSGLYEKAKAVKKAQKVAGKAKKTSTAAKTGKKKSRWPVILIILLILIAIGVALWYLLNTGIITLPDQFWAVASQQTEQPQTTAPPASSAAPASEPVASAASATPAQPAATPQTTAPIVTPQTTAPVTAAPVQTPPAVATPQRVRPPAPVASYPVPATIPREGVAYRIRYGDTLWDIAAAFYKNPWLYPQIARFNNIRNPDRIISGTTIRIPPRN